MEYSRGPASILPVLAERDWNVGEGDNSIVPQNSPKPKPQIGATRDLSPVGSLCKVLNACRGLDLSYGNRGHGLRLLSTELLMY